MSPETTPAWDDAAYTAFPCECGDPTVPGTHRTRGLPCQHDPQERP